MTQDARHCPVCGRAVREEYPCKHLGVRHVCCSPTCRENLLAWPRLYAGPREPVIKRRRLRFRPAPDAGAVRTRLARLPGVIHAEQDGADWRIAYDLTCIRLEQIERALAQHGIRPADGLWWRIRRSWLHASERNELDLLAEPPGACCNRPPPH